MELVNQPLVSVAVITYNSSKTVVETLDSIYNQTYRNLELIVSDDCSTDNTVEICKEWIDVHKERFVRIELLTIEKNTGVSANMNRGADACRGEWVKDIAGDDLLMPKCIETYINYVSEHPDVVYVFSKVVVFGVEKEKVLEFKEGIFDYSFFDLSIEQQYKWLICRDFQPIPAATSFYNRKKVLEKGFIYDERIPMLEDWPRWIQCLEKGVRFHFIDKELVKYRVSETSICSGTKYSDAFIRSLSLMYIYYQYEPSKKYLGKWKAWVKYVDCKRKISNNIIWKGLNSVNNVLLFFKKHVKRILRKFNKKIRTSANCKNCII